MSNRWGAKPPDSQWGTPPPPPSNPQRGPEGPQTRAMPQQSQSQPHTSTARRIPVKLIAIVVAVVVLIAVGVFAAIRLTTPPNCSHPGLGNIEEQGYTVSYCNGTWALMSPRDPEIQGDREFLFAWDGEKWIGYDRNISQNGSATCFQEPGLRDDGAPERLIKKVKLCP
ncbi:hypothetical protein [Corynebacterium glucuronolyticum]|uniref:hypothetical protein n=1 Tax=Corynebacterium glucuronolyticum TaxID=39791 RepID=UPI00223B6F7C|nr:hypothetical protein [Corynebacterium glucuronolyticum]MCT1442155.1 hypothetical protein [Corynebacterium glucuronolyticum]